MNHTTSTDALLIKLDLSKALNLIDIYIKDHLVEFCTKAWDHMGITLMAHNSSDLKFKVTDKEKFTYVALKYDVPIEVIDNI